MKVEIDISNEALSNELGSFFASLSAEDKAKIFKEAVEAILRKDESTVVRDPAARLEFVRKRHPHLSQYDLDIKLRHLKLFVLDLVVDEMVSKSMALVREATNKAMGDSGGRLQELANTMGQLVAREFPDYVRSATIISFSQSLGDIGQKVRDLELAKMNSQWAINEVRARLGMEPAAAWPAGS